MPKARRRNQNERAQALGMQGGKGRGNRAAHGIAQKRKIACNALILEQFLKLVDEKGAVLRAIWPIAIAAPIEVIDQHAVAKFAQSRRDALPDKRGRCQAMHTNRHRPARGPQPAIMRDPT